MNPNLNQNTANNQSVNYSMNSEQSLISKQAGPKKHMLPPRSGNDTKNSSFSQGNYSSMNISGTVGG
jgi:hypothetical protein